MVHFFKTQDRKADPEHAVTASAEDDTTAGTPAGTGSLAGLAAVALCFNRTYIGGEQLYMRLTGNPNAAENDSDN